MKNSIHPNYQECEIRCTCGSLIPTRSTKKEIHISICGKCHPFYTGKQKFVDTAGRIEKFQKKFALSEGQTVEAIAQKQKQTHREAIAKAKTIVSVSVPTTGKKRKKVAEGEEGAEAKAEAAPKE